MSPHEIILEKNFERGDGQGQQTGRKWESQLIPGTGDPVNRERWARVSKKGKAFSNFTDRRLGLWFH